MTNFYPIYGKQKGKTGLQLQTLAVSLKGEKKSMKNLFSVVEKDITNLKYVKEGIENEPAAIKKYVSLKGKAYVFKVGLVINPGFPVAGCSPDGLVYDEEKNEYGLLEVKTFSKAKTLNLTVPEAIARKDLNTCLKIDKSGKVSLKRTHNYFYQVIGQLGISGLRWCDFFVDTGIDIFCERIEFDTKLFSEIILPKLKDFYFDHFIQRECD